MPNLLLVSSSRTHGTGFLEHCRTAIAAHFAGVPSVLFVPYALQDLDGYEATVRAALAPIGLHTQSIHRMADPRRAVLEASAIFVGGGNTFRLLKALYETDLVTALRERIAGQAVPYLGSSAGTNLACPTIRTTNDMPIVQPPTFAALGLIPFQINPHYVDPDPTSTHKGETREQRLIEYLEENATPVIGLREGSWLEVRGETITLGGNKSARIFARGEPPRELPSGADLSWLVRIAASQS